MVSVINKNEGLQCITDSKCHGLYEIIPSTKVLLVLSISISEIVRNQHWANLENTEGILTKIIILMKCLLFPSV